MPCGAAGGCHVVLFGRHLFQEVLGFLNGTHIGTNGHFHNPGKSKLLHGGYQLAGGDLAAELADESGSHQRDDFVTLQNGLDYLVDLALIHDGTEGTAYQTLTAGDALILIDDSTALVVGADGIHAAAGGTGTFQMNDGIVGACLGALAAADAFVKVNVGTVVPERDGVLGADLLAGTCQTVLAIIADLVLVTGTGMAGIGDDVDQRGLIVLLCNGSSVHALGNQMAAVTGTQAEAHGKTNAFTGNGTFQEYRFPVQRAVAGYNLIRQFVNTFVTLSGICHPGDFGENFFADVRNQRRNTSHNKSSVSLIRCQFTILPAEMLHKNTINFSIICE